MDIKNALLKEHSKTQTEKITKYIGVDKVRFAVLMNCFFSSDTILSQRASWVMSRCAESFPLLITRYLKKMVYNLENPVHDAVKRNTVRMLQNIDIPKQLKGKVVEVCFNLLGKSSEAVAIKVFSMTVLLNIVKQEPELKNELKIIIEDQMPFAKAAFLSRGRKTLKQLDKIH